MRLLLRRLVTIASALAVVGLIIWAYLPKPVEADLEAVSRGRLRVTVDQEGKTRIRERYVVSAPLSGRLQRIELKPGHTIVAGETLLAAIEPPDPSLLDARVRAESEARVEVARSTLKRTQSMLEKARVARDFAQKNRERIQQLIRANSISQEEFDVAENRELTAAEELRASSFSLLIAEYELQLAEAALLRSRPPSSGERDHSRFLIHAPISGVVLRVFQESSTFATPGMSLIEVGDPTDLECEVDVLSADAVKIPQGARVFLEHWGGDMPLQGRVRQIEPSAFTKISALGVEEQRVWVIVDLDETARKSSRLGDRYRVEAKIVIWEAERVLQVPSGALFRQADRWAIFVVQNGKAHFRLIKTGHSNGLQTEVLEGLEEGDQVVVHPSDRIVDGTSVIPRDRK